MLKYFFNNPLTLRPSFQVVTSRPCRIKNCSVGCGLRDLTTSNAAYTIGFVRDVCDTSPGTLNRQLKWKSVLCTVCSLFRLVSSCKWLTSYSQWSRGGAGSRRSWNRLGRVPSKVAKTNIWKFRTTYKWYGPFYIQTCKGGWLIITIIIGCSA